MDSKKLLIEIGDLIEKKLQPIREQLTTVEMKVEIVNKRIEQAQEETVEALSELFKTGYEMHEKKIKEIETQLPTHQLQ
ncbi:MAG TPA: hypothetical protein VLG12_03675 [Candidatus Saccharimonadales bacterium]|nr:hypothetical protein [Candidatus Saccharimonadales bacterium]